MLDGNVRLMNERDRGLSCSRTERAGHRYCCWEGLEDPNRTATHLGLLALGEDQGPALKHRRVPRGPPAQSCLCASGDSGRSCGSGWVHRGHPCWSYHGEVDAVVAAAAVEGDCGKGPCD